MNRRVYYDLESTSVDAYTARIVEFAFLDERGEAFNERVNPGIPIPADATAVHGIGDADVADCPAFAHFAPRIQELIEGACLVGYACRRFDTPLLHAELVRAGQPGLALDKAGRIAVPEIDLLQIWYRLEERTLAGAAKRFAGVELDDAHRARGDADVLARILEGMVRAFGIGSDLQRLIDLSIPEGAIDRDGKFIRRADREIVFGFGPQKDEPVQNHPGLLEWMLKKDFAPETKTIAEILLRRIGKVQA